MTVVVLGAVIEHVVFLVAAGITGVNAVASTRCYDIVTNLITNIQTKQAEEQEQ